MANNPADLLEQYATDTAEEVVTHEVEIPKGHFLSDEEGNVAKIAIFGPPGSGKTRFLVDLLLEGEKLFVVSSDVGGNGLVTVRNELKKLKKTNLLKNVYFVDIFKYEQVLAFWKDPYKHFGDVLEKFKPTVLVWEGFSAFQVQSVDEFIMPEELRPEKDLGLDPFVYWDKVRRATQRVHDHWIQSFPGIHHILTCHEAEPQEADPKTNRKAQKRRAWIQGSSAKLIEAGYDLILLTSRIEEYDPETLETTLRYRYKVGGDTDQVSVKNRGYDLPDEFDADGRKVWKAVTS